ncbi:hypothetical protein I7I53_01441 [Histoplasma capsulatum var. duboisii H88]|uniref:Uncharacterized protein n=1 Tax=Ajellomyces capsulatus (strain H88) TaxID=544711 RepID=A0A8A1LLS8_AJEC8|nr:hypothetical protein I7I53_01441 [Histoplasma capsulatum var. duboisii H88]
MLPFCISMVLNGGPVTAVLMYQLVGVLNRANLIPDGLVYEQRHSRGPATAHLPRPVKHSCRDRLIYRPVAMNKIRENIVESPVNSLDLAIGGVFEKFVPFVGQHILIHPVSEVGIGFGSAIEASKYETRKCPSINRFYDGGGIDNCAA